jgi:conserved domain protein|nr:MAG TPA: Receptor Binding Protein [Caudoviricetes sp.]
MIGFPFDSHVTFESDGTPVYDRAITSAPLRKLIAKLLTDGVLPNPSTNLQVEAGSGMNVVVNPGFAICAGGLKLEENQRTLAIQAADSNYDRIDTVVLRWNDNDSERICDLYIVEGIPAASPLRPELTRTESIWELGLADLFINKNSSAISNQRITDTRYETARCGIISAISEFDTTTLYQQVQADLAGFKASEQADFIAWFDDIKGQLSEDAAGNLQKQIGTLEALKTEVKTNLVNALNWVVDKTSGVIAKLGSADISKIGDGTVTGAIVNNKEAIEDVSQSLTNINTYVGKDKKLHFVDSSGADTVLPFNSYDDGRIQGRNDVIGSPNSYGLYTKAQYDANKVTYKSGNYNTGLNGETWRSTSFNTGFSNIIALQINCWNDEGNGYFNAFKNVRISGGKVSLDFYAADYVDNYVQWLAVGK